MLHNRHIFIVEDEAALASVLEDYLTYEGARVSVLNKGVGALEAILTAKPDLVILDVMLPDVDGLTLCREIRAKSDMPIILESARTEELDRLLGLDLGADDYICKPWSPREVVARARAVLRRSGPAQMGPGESGLALDTETWTATLDGRPLELTRREFQLLQVLSQRPGRVYSRNQLLNIVFADERSVFERTVDSHIKNIRNKVKAIDPQVECIRSVYGVGYAFEVDRVAGSPESGHPA